MHKMIAVAIAFTLIAIATPTVQAGEVITRPYDVPSGVQAYTCGNPACAISWGICTPGWDDWEGGIFSGEEDDALGPPLTTAFTTACGTAREARDRPDGAALSIGVSGIVSDCGDCYFDFLVSIADTLPADTYFTFCIITEHQDGRDDSDNFCGDVDPRDPTQTADDIDDPRVETCGSASLSSPVASGGEDNIAVGFVFSTYVDESNAAVCLGSSGEFVTDMS